MTVPLPSNVTPIVSATQAAANAAGWGTAGGGYDIDRFYTQAKTSATASPPGAFEYLKIKVTPWVYAQLRDMVESNDIPSYTSPDDVMRDALYHRLHYLGDSRGTPDFRRKTKHFCEQLDHDQAVADAELHWHKLTDLLARSRVMFEKYAEDEGWRMLQQMIEMHRLHADAWEDCKTKRELLKLCDGYEKKIPEGIITF